MLVRAKVSFAGAFFNMAKDEVKECSDEAILQDLLSCGYIEEVKAEAEPKPMKVTVKTNESKRSSSK